MKKIIFISIVMSLVATAAMAQNQKGANVLVPGEPIPIDGPGGGGGVTNYYINATGTITKPGYTYRYRNESGFDGEGTSVLLELYNAANPYLDIEWGYKDGGQMSLAKALGEDNNPEFSYRSLTRVQTCLLVDGLFTAHQKTTLKGKIMSFVVRFDSSTGKIKDVYFIFRRDSPFVNIPVETYRSIELALKENLTITVTDEGRRLNYIQMYWPQRF